jgi:hypothetical protein
MRGRILLLASRLALSPRPRVHSPVRLSLHCFEILRLSIVVVDLCSVESMPQRAQPTTSKRKKKKKKKFSVRKKKKKFQKKKFSKKSPSTRAKERRRHTVKHTDFLAATLSLALDKSPSAARFTAPPRAAAAVAPNALAFSVGIEVSIDAFDAMTPVVLVVVVVVVLLVVRVPRNAYIESQSCLLC